MKKTLITILVAIAFIAGPVYSQNTDKNTQQLTTQMINHLLYETTEQVLRTTFADKPVYVATVMDSATALADSVDFLDGKLIGIIVDTGWTAAAMTFQGYNEETATWHNLYTDDGGELSYSAAADRWILAVPEQFAGIRRLIARSGTAAVPVNQAYARSIIYVTRRY